MKNQAQRFLTYILCTSMSLSLVGCSSNHPISDSNNAADAVVTESVDIFEDAGENSIALMHYLLTVSGTITEESGNRYILDDLYNELNNNIHLSAIDNETQKYLTDLKDILYKLSEINIQRDRLTGLFNETKAEIIQQYVPVAEDLVMNVVTLDYSGITQSLFGALNTCIGAAVDTEYLLQGWDLDDSEREEIHNNRQIAFNYLLDKVQTGGVPEEQVLTDQLIKDFLEHISDENNYQKLEYLKLNEKTYKKFPKYWLELGKSYFGNQQYEECLATLAAYMEMQPAIFVKDYDLGKAMPAYIASAANVYSEDEYPTVVKEYLQIIDENTDDKDWELRYYAAQVYTDLYVKTDDVVNLENAYGLLKSNVIELVDQQKSLSAAYMGDLAEVEISKSDRTDSETDVKKAEEKKIKEYNKELKEKRKTELAPVYAPLSMNLELLYAITDQLELAENDKRNFDGIVHDLKNPVFLTETINNHYSFSPQETAYDCHFEKNTIILPGNILSDDSIVTVLVTDSDKSMLFDDFIIKKVERDEKDYAKFRVTLTGKAIDKYVWTENSRVTVNIYEPKCNFTTEVQFKTSKYKKNLAWTSIEFELVR